MCLDRLEATAAALKRSPILGVVRVGNFRAEISQRRVQEGVELFVGLSIETDIRYRGIRIESTGLLIIDLGIRVSVLTTQVRFHQAARHLERNDLEHPYSRFRD